MDKADYYWEEYIADMDLIGMMTKPIEAARRILELLRGNK